MLVWACFAMQANARQGAETADGVGNDADPIACWWRTDRSAVQIGEQFTLTLTCSVSETSDVRVVTDRDRLDPAALDLAPFEIMGGTRHDDIQSPPRRYFKYSYTLRLFGDEHFGKDVDVPSIPITYRIETSGVTATRGRDQVYLLPALPVRMLSLVPVAATDILDASPDVFGDIDRRALRATAEFTAAGVLFTFAAALAVVAVVRIARPGLAGATAARGLLLPIETVRGCVREAARLKSEAARAGWTDDLIGEALTVVRLGAAVALERPVAQHAIDGGVAAQHGQLAIRKSALRAKRVLLSAATTSPAVAARLAEGTTIDPRLRITLEQLGESLRVFEAARYSRSTDLAAPALDASLESAIDALQRLYAMRQWPARTVDALSRAAERLKGAVWNR
jgi:hypothetical protein